MRDRLMDAKYWDDIIRYSNEEIEESKDRTARVIASKGEDFYGVKRGYIRRNSLYMTTLNSLYSSGASLDEMKILLPDVLETFTKSWTDESGYFDMIQFLSICILLDAPVEIIEELERLVKENDYNDYLLSFLFKSANLSFETEISTLNVQMPYQHLISVIESATKEESIYQLKIYLEKIWYESHSDEDWHNSHRNRDSFYSGSYESGAIAKILNLDDTGWENMKYYPYDMVHYKK